VALRVVLLPRAVVCPRRLVAVAHDQHRVIQVGDLLAAVAAKPADLLQRRFTIEYKNTRILV
jgi:hypothetical protein